MKSEVLPTKTEVLIHRLRLMSESGGLITKDRRRTIMEAAGRLSELDEAMKIIKEQAEAGGGTDEKC